MRGFKNEIFKWQVKFARSAVVGNAENRADICTECNSLAGYCSKTTCLCDLGNCHSGQMTIMQAGIELATRTDKN